MSGSGSRRGAVIVAAGSGERLGDPGKVLVEVRGLPLLLYSARAFRSVPAINVLVVVLGAHTLEAGAEALRRDGGCTAARVVLGGTTRAESVRAGLAALAGDAEVVAVHDAARPLVRQRLIESVFAAADEAGAAVPVLPVSSTLVRLGPGGDVHGGVIDRKGVRAAQTPQAARLNWLEDALARYPAETDEGSALVQAGYPVRLVPGDPRNIKVTWPGDIELVETLMGAGSWA